MTVVPRGFALSTIFTYWHKQEIASNIRFIPENGENGCFWTGLCFLVNRPFECQNAIRVETTGFPRSCACTSGPYWPLVSRCIVWVIASIVHHFSSFFVRWETITVLRRMLLRGVFIITNNEQVRICNEAIVVNLKEFSQNSLRKIRRNL